MYHRVIGLDLSTRNSIVISTRIASDFIVGLTRDPDSYTPNTMYEIVIGGAGNSQSIIR
jgi:Farnesoic acid 0-methyl transferase